MFVARHSHVDRNPRSLEAIAVRLREDGIKSDDSQRAEKTRILRLANRRIWAEQRRRIIIERYFEDCRTGRAHRLSTGTHKLDYICRWVCRLYGVTKDDLRSERRAARTTLATHAYYYWARELTPCSLPVIGRFIGKHHTTVLHGATRYEGSRFKKRKIIRNRYPGKTIWWRS